MFARHWHPLPTDVTTTQICVPYRHQTIAKAKACSRKVGGATPVNKFGKCQ